MFAPVCGVLLLVGCTDQPRGRDAGDLSDGGFDAGDAATGPDASDDNDSGDPNPSCSARFDALDATCSVDSDCAVAIQYACWGGGSGISRALGVVRTSHAAALSLAVECDLPRPENAQQRCPGEGGGLAPLFTQDQGAGESSPYPFDVRCHEQRCTTVRTLCGVALCGNAMIDACQQSSGEFGPVYSSVSDPAAAHWREECDGADLAGNTCDSRGYGSGTLGCVADGCRFDTSGCSACAPVGGALQACAEQGLRAANVEGFALATSGTLTAIALATHDGVGAKVAVAIYDEALVQRSFVTLPPGTIGSTQVQFAAYPGGWVLAAADGEWEGDTYRPYVELHRFSADGAYQGVARRLVDVERVRLVQHPTAAPLLLYTETTATSPVVLAVALGSNLDSASAPSTVGAGVVVDAVHVGDGYLVAYAEDEYQRFQIRRVESDGSVVAQPVSYPAGQTRPALAYGAGHRWLSFVFESEVSVLVELDEDGEVLDDSPRAQLPEALYGVRYMVGASDGVRIAWYEQRTGDQLRGTEVHVARVDREGAIVTRTMVARYPQYGFAAGLQASGDGVVVVGLGGRSPYEGALDPILVDVARAGL